MFKTTFTLLAILLTIQLSAQSNAQWRGDNRDGIYNESGLLKQWPENGPELLWQYDLLGAGHASAAVTEEIVYTAGTNETDGFIIAFDHSGKEIWKTVYGKEWLENWDGVRSTPTIYEGKVYQLSGYGVIYCFDGNTGDILWQEDLIEKFGAQNIKFGITENLVVDEDKVFVTIGALDASVIALHKDTGIILWKCTGTGEKSAYCSPALIQLPEAKIFVTHTEKHILCINPINGELIWKHEFLNKYVTHANTPFYHEGYLYCVTGTAAGGVKIELAPNGDFIKEVWRNTTLDSKLGGFIFTEGRICGAGDANKNWSCIDWESGKELFNSTEISKKGNVIYADGLMYWYSESGEIALVEVQEDKFNIISKFEVPFGEKWHWSHLVIHNKKLYVRHGSYLMVYDIAAK
ncbi:MAG: PQQ-binding-like beta-propeller repeat protein [Bacteroidetes bacterium]|jgi:outer membrane protein assembly factor BamB|nr:PQQ-binding-like beta-propeller repeat protein [Bacteroidota bacterium]MBT5529492.1 PQQ-binding-like beta-propeller repeat protein [Cytophagia bacterium]MBT3424421.1 PQQ-binding-like beta-propeller repeat protein [Bacteroidota bacterium]MBT3802258.1 PQQ-binding-like beta-propeller repeat protein [Bacteroidota bacterium]MBT3934078.1 PQQ-binding-like beta-propeller repeat protein [Bacteroidota bacterium]